MNFPISVKQLRSVAGKGNLRAFATVELGPLTVHGVRVIQQLGQRAYVLGPQIQDAGKRWWPVVIFSEDATKARIQSAVLEAWEESKR